MTDTKSSPQAGKPVGTPQEQDRLVEALKNPEKYDHPVSKIDHKQTHISHVLLTGEFVYKIKKPLDFGFLDFTTLEKRRFYCDEEIRLNRRLVPELYLDKVPIGGAPDNPVLYGAGPAIEYAVKMKQFPQENQLDRVMERGELKEEHLLDLAKTLAQFHSKIAVAPADSRFGTPEQVHAPAKDNFPGTRPQLSDPKDLEALDRLEKWTDEQYERLKDLFARRKEGGKIRECHGDLHLANLVLLDGKVVPFDCIEFNDDFRWIDVTNDVAFLVMDLDHRGRRDLGTLFLNAYLEASGDYEGLNVLRYYQAYRAMVRAKVTTLRLGQPGLSDAEKEEALSQYRGYIRLAQSYAEPAGRGVVLTCGLSGSGKTTVARELSKELGMIHVRSDVERKRLFGMNAAARSASGIETGLYDPKTTVRTYARLADLARTALEAGYPVIVDAASLKKEQRLPFRKLAQTEGVPYLVLRVTAPETTLKERLASRNREGKDASEADTAVLEHQLKTREEPTGEEAGLSVTVDTCEPADVKRATAQIESHLR